jgi:hypothetical protein
MIRYPRYVGTPCIEYVERKFQLSKAILSKITGMIYTFSKVGLFLDTPHLIYLRDVLFSFPIEEASSLLIFMVTVDTSF